MDTQWEMHTLRASFHIQLNNSLINSVSTQKYFDFGKHFIFALLKGTIMHCPITGVNNCSYNVTELKDKMNNILFWFIKFHKQKI